MNSEQQDNYTRFLGAVREKWREDKFLDRMARLLKQPRDKINLQTRVSLELVEAVINDLTWHGCSIDRGLLPKGRSPTLGEIRDIFSYHSGGD